MVYQLFFGLKHSSTFSCNSWLGTRVFSRIVHGSVATDRAHVSCQSWFPLSDSFRFTKHHEKYAWYGSSRSGDISSYFIEWPAKVCECVQVSQHTSVAKLDPYPYIFNIPFPTAVGNTDRCRLLVWWGDSKKLTVRIASTWIVRAQKLRSPRVPWKILRCEESQLQLCDPEDIKASNFQRSESLQFWPFISYDWL